MVYLVGAGPGDTGLITVKALNIIRQADVILYDSLINYALLYDTKPECILIDVGKHAGNHTKTQDETTQLLAEYGRKWLNVVRLKGGDPFMFGRGGEEAEYLSKEGVPFTIVPGVSALSAVPAYAGIPLTHRDHASSVGIATGHGAGGKSTDPVRWRELANGVDTLVVFMGVGTIKTIISEISASKLSGDTPAAIIEQGTTPSQRVVKGTLSTIADLTVKEHISPPALLIIGNIVLLADSLDWYHPGQLNGLNIGVTRPFDQSKSFSEKLSALGANPILMPTIKTVDTIETEEIKNIITEISRYDYIIYSSVNGVASFFRALKKYGADSRKLTGIKIASIGPVTADALSKHGISADVRAKTFVAEGVLDSLFSKGSVKGLRFLLVRSDIGRNTIRDELVKAGAEVKQAVFYSTQTAILSPFIKNMIKSGSIDIITYTSSSTVTNFFAQISPDNLGNRVRLASIGPQTSQALRKHNKTPDIEASEYTTDGLARAILEDYKSNKAYYYVNK